MIRWGVVGPGEIATRFATAMRRVDDGEIVAVASRSIDRADRYADEFDIAGRYNDVRALLEDDAVDAVYIATPASHHEVDTVAALEAGKHVLCEKPLALNAAQAARMVATAQASGTFLMEAIWSRFLPSYRTLVDVLAERRIGDVLQVDADFGMRLAFDPGHRLFDRAQGGGALLDLGIYPLQLCTLVLGPIEGIVASGHIGDSGVDEQVAAVTRHAGGRLGVVKAALRAPLACTARISGTDGWIDIPAFMHCPTSFTIHPFGALPETVEAPIEGDGLEHEIAEVHNCLADRRAESPAMPLQETLELARAMDDIRAQIGLTYPVEDPCDAGS